MSIKGHSAFGGERGSSHNLGWNVGDFVI